MLRELGLLAAILLSAVDVQPRASDPSFHVIVNQANPVQSLTRPEVSAIFMRRTRSWPDGSEIVPVDQGTGTPLRELFSRTVHGKSVAFVTRYWQRLIFAGRAVPPAELGSDEEVIAFVGRNEGAIGYITTDTAAGSSVRIIAVTK